MPVQRRPRTGNQTLVRQINLTTIMRFIHKSAPISRATLAEVTGLNKTTVSSLVQELIEARLVHETGYESAGTGRPSIKLELDPDAGYMIGAEIGVDFVSIICTDFSIKPLWQQREIIPPEMSQSQIIEQALNLVRQAIAAVGDSHDRLLGVALGVPGLVKQDNGMLLFAPNLKWSDVPLKTIFHEALNAPVFIDNEANLAALGEHYFGAGQGVDEMLFVSAGVGLGGAVIQGGHLLSGGTGYAGEFGHMTMNPSGELCNCGNRGCWETMVSQSALFRRIKQAIEVEGQNSVLLTIIGTKLANLTVPLVVEAIQQGDTVAREALDSVGRDLGMGISSLVNALNPNLVIFGGILSLAGEYLLPVINAQLQQRALMWHRNATRLVLAQHGSDACVIGGVATIYHSILTHPSQFTP